ncbi:hypothetical protein SUGI_0752100 [Cryptomeria japonica]|nr:hypothetical protein SUGI_0752100 [Cryptomeria japonica]
MLLASHCLPHRQTVGDHIIMLSSPLYFVTLTASPGQKYNVDALPRKIRGLVWRLNRHRVISVRGSFSFTLDTSSFRPADCVGASLRCQKNQEPVT